MRSSTEPGWGGVFTESVIGLAKFVETDGVEPFMVPQRSIRN